MDLFSRHYATCAYVSLSHPYWRFSIQFSGNTTRPLRHRKYVQAYRRRGCGKTIQKKKKQAEMRLNIHGRDAMLERILAGVHWRRI